MYKVWNLPALLLLHFPAWRGIILSLRLFCVLWSICGGMLAGFGLAQWLRLPALCNLVFALPIAWGQFRAYTGLFDARLARLLSWRTALCMLVFALLSAAAAAGLFGILCAALGIDRQAHSSAALPAPMFFEACAYPKHFDAGSLTGFAMLLFCSFLVLVLSLFPLLIIAALPAQSFSQYVRLHYLSTDYD